MGECPWCGSRDVMDDGRGWWFCNECPWGEDVAGQDPAD